MRSGWSRRQGATCKLQQGDRECESSREQIFRACLRSLMAQESLFQCEKEADVFERLIRKRY